MKTNEPYVTGEEFTIEVGLKLPCGVTLTCTRNENGDVTIVDANQSMVQSFGLTDVEETIFNDEDETKEFNRLVEEAIGPMPEAEDKDES